MKSISALVSVLVLPLLIRAQGITLGTASTFGVLGASTVTNTGQTHIIGNLGVSPGTAITGFPPGAATATDDDDTLAANAQSDALSAYNTAAGMTTTTVLTGADLGGMTLTAGVYTFASSAGLTGTLTLNGQGNPNALFVFQMGSTLITASSSNVVLVNGAKACNVIWQVGSSATLGTGTHFAGIILAYASITGNSGVVVSGSLIALHAAVTLINDQITVVNTCNMTSASITSSASGGPPTCGCSCTILA